MASTQPSLRVVKPTESATAPIVPPWFEGGLRPNVDPEVNLEPDGTIEVTFDLGKHIGSNGSRATFLLSQSEAKILSDQIAHILTTGRVRRGKPRH